MGALLAGLLASGCAATLDSAAIQDAQLAVRVRTALVNDPEVGAYPIDVTVRLAVVTLTGTVGSQAHVERAVERVRGVPGVREVTPALRVDPSAGTERISVSPSVSRGSVDPDLLDSTEGPRPGLLALGGSVSRSVPEGRALRSALGIGPLVRLGSGQGFGPGFGFSWFTADVQEPGAPGRAGTLKIRPLMLGVAYTARRGRGSASLSLVGGWSLNGIDPDTRSAGRAVAVDVDNSVAARSGVSVWIDLSDRTAFNTFVGYLMTRPRVTFLEAGRVETRTVRADVVLVSAGLVYKLF